ncbi:MAG: hypothetical protein V3V21_08390 [Thermoplasmata archaeon]
MRIDSRTKARALKDLSSHETRVRLRGASELARSAREIAPGDEAIRVALDIIKSGLDTIPSEYDDEAKLYDYLLDLVWQSTDAAKGKRGEAAVVQAVWEECEEVAWLLVEHPNLDMRLRYFGYNYLRDHGSLGDGTRLIRLAEKWKEVFARGGRESGVDNHFQAIIGIGKRNQKLLPHVERLEEYLLTNDPNGQRAILARKAREQLQQRRD